MSSEVVDSDATRLEFIEAELRSEALGLFADYADHNDTELMDVLAGSALHAEVNTLRKTPERVIDRTALLRSMIALGIAFPNLLSGKLVATFTQHSGKVTMDSAPLLNPRILWEARAKGIPLVLSDSLRAKVIPNALRAAMEHTKSRHMTLISLWRSLLQDPATRWEGIISPIPTPEDIAALINSASFDLQPADAPRTDPPPTPRESIRTVDDDPAETDGLMRLPFARAICSKIRDIRAKDKGSFMVNVHGTWGSGKSSVLKFMERELVEDYGWLVIRFDAWQHQRSSPAWWPLMLEVYKEASHKAAPHRRLALMAVWLWWRLMSNMLPALIAAILFAVAVGLGLFSLPSFFGGKGSIEVATIGSFSTLLTGLGGIYAFGRALAYGGGKSIDTTELRADPHLRIVKLFKRIATVSGKPIIVFVDDLDRCAADYVVDLLESIQTLFRAIPIVYVVAADRRWVSTAFAERYAKFDPVMRTPGRPIGFLYLSKMFQLSASLPCVPPQILKDFWRNLLSEDPAAGVARTTIEAQAKSLVAGKTNAADLFAAIDEVEDPQLREHVIAEASVQIVSQEASSEAEHRLLPFFDLLEPNPREIKRLVNAVDMNQSRLMMEQRRISLEAVARWTLLELRWPQLAELLTEESDKAGDILVKNNTGPQCRDALDDPELWKVVGDKKSPGHLNAKQLLAILS